MKPTTNPALERDALYSKSQVYIRRGLRAQADGDTEEYQLWASLALELLGKAALSKVHPALIADPMHYESLFAACGRQMSPDIKTITAKTLFERLSHIDKTFDSRHQKFCSELAIRRNAELHSGQSPFSGMSADAWEREFWGAMVIVLAMQDETLESWLGARNSKAPTKIVEQAQEAIEWAVGDRILRSKESFDKAFKSAPKKKKAASDATNLTWSAPEWDGQTRSTCPACGCLGHIGGMLWNEEVVETEPATWEPDGDEGGYAYPPVEIVEKIYTSEFFRCKTCGLVLNGISEVQAAGLADDFAERVERELEFEPDYGND